MTGLTALSRAGCASRLATARLASWDSGAILTAVGALALAVGVLVYAADRGVSHSALVPGLAVVATGSLFGVVGQWLPSFVHPLAFSLFTAAAQPSNTSPAYWACATWWFVNVAFEVAQLPGINLAVATFVQDASGQSELTRPLSSYVLRGTFDVGDLVAATAGAIAAAGVLYLVHRLEVRHEA